MNLLFVSHTAEIGGAELSLLELVRGLKDRGFRVSVALPGVGPLEGLLQSAGASIWKLNYFWWVREKRPLFILCLVKHARSVKDFARLLKRLTPDIVITQTLTIPAAALAARAMGIPHIWSIHEFGKKDHGFCFDIGRTNCARLINALSSKVVVNSRAVSEEFSKYIPAHKRRVTYQAVEVPDHGLPRHFADDGFFRLILVGMIKPSKGQEDAVRALAILRQQIDKIKLTLVGEVQPEYSAYLRELATRLGVHDAIEMVGFTEKRFEKILQSDVALMCSRCEAFGRVTIEAMKLGVPVISSSSGATGELVREGWNGLVYQPGDAKDLASKIELLYRNACLRDTLAKNGRVWATNMFSTKKYVNEFVGILTDVLSQGDV